MSDPFADQRNRYKHTVPASALLFNNQYQEKALRVEAQSIGLEFTDNVYIGSDPDGLLSYNYLKDFHKDDSNKKADYYIESASYKDIPCIHILFYHDGNKDRPFAEFIAEDPTNAAGRSDMLNTGSSGFWKNLDIGSATASIDKDGDNDTVTLTFPTIHRKATFETTGTPAADVSLDIHGTVYFKDINSINNGFVVNYTSDRLVFYPDAMYAKDFTGYFIPFEGQSLEMDQGCEIRDVKWTTTS